MVKRNKLTKAQRDKIADKLMLLGNIVFSGMIIAPLVSTPLQSTDAYIAIGGGLIFGGMYLGAVQVMRGGDRD